jgi:hypothetical protein
MQQLGYVRPQTKSSFAGLVRGVERVGKWCRLEWQGIARLNKYTRDGKA